MGCIRVTSQVPDHCISVTSQVPDHCIDITSTERGECIIPIPIPQFEYIDSGYGSAEYDTSGRFISYEQHTTQIRITNLPDILDLGLYYEISTGYPTRVDESDGTVSVDLPSKDNNLETIVSWQFGVRFFDTCGKYAQHIETISLEYIKEGVVYYERTDGSSGWLYPSHFSGLFYTNNSIKKVVIYKLPKDDTNWNHICYNCFSLEFFDVLCDTGIVTSMTEAWNNCGLLTSFPNINTSSVTDMSGTWASCHSLTSFPHISTGSVTNMYRTWQYCHSLTSFPHIDTGSVTNMHYTWDYCTSLTSFPLIDTSSVVDMYGTWGSCTSLASFPHIDTGSVTNMSWAWVGCHSLTSFPHISTGSVVDMSWAWDDCRNLPIETCKNGYARYLFDDETPVPSGDGRNC